MDYQQSWAAKGHSHHPHHPQHSQGGRERHLYSRSRERAAVNIYRTDNSFEVLLFAPGRIREHFHLEVKGNQLVISYAPPEGFPRPDWVVREYSRGGFVRSLFLDDSIDPALIQAKYLDGVLQVSLPLVPGRERVKHEIVVG
ncbi:MAG TPA: Hsp20/alpha crystallin family protein [Puia sp.]|jgi:HSP20 family protein